ncbi:MAG: exodeoxyribonuclease VII small subunit [Nocardioides sp.]
MTEKVPTASAGRGKRTTAAANIGAPPATYEAARDELVEVVRRLETGGTTLEESLGLWERGEELATICQDWLDGAVRRLDNVAEPAADSSM